MGKDQSKIVLLADIYQLREQKQKELDYYNERLKELQTKLFFVQKEIQITNYIIDLIEKEKIHSIGSRHDQSEDVE